MAHKGNYKCAECGREFGMPAHLGRHMSTLHAAKSKRGRRAARAAAPAARGPRAALNGGGLLSNLRAARDEMRAQREQLDGQLAALDRVLDVLGGAAPARVAVRRAGRTNGRARTGSLRTYIENVLRKRSGPMRVSEIADAVKKAGYPTRNKTLAKTVGITLSRMPSVQKLGRGVFRAK